MTNESWDNGNWLGHCWLRFKQHRWTMLAYRRWPDVEVVVCARCGRKRVK